MVGWLVGWLVVGRSEREFKELVVFQGYGTEEENVSLGFLFLSLSFIQPPYFFPSCII